MQISLFIETAKGLHEVQQIEISGIDHLTMFEHEAASENWSNSQVHFIPPGLLLLRMPMPTES